MLAQVGNVLKKDDRMAKRHVIEQDQVLVNLPHISYMRHHGHRITGFRNKQNFIHAIYFH